MTDTQVSKTEALEARTMRRRARRRRQVRENRACARAQSRTGLRRRRRGGRDQAPPQAIARAPDAGDRARDRRLALSPPEPLRSRSLCDSIRQRRYPRGPAGLQRQRPDHRMLVQEGDAVKAGELIATLDDTRYAATLAQAEGQMRNQEQVLARLLAGSRPEEIAQAKATMDALDVTYQNDKVNYRRAQRLARNRGRDHPAARRRQGGVRHGETTIRGGAAGLHPRSYRAAAGGHRRSPRGATRRLRAPSPWPSANWRTRGSMRRRTAIVEDRILEPGDMASPTTPVYTIALTSPLWVRAYVPETELGQIRPRHGRDGQRPTVSRPRDIAAGSAISRRRRNSPRRRWRLRNCAPRSSISCASMSAMRAASCGSACRRRSHRYVPAGAASDGARLRSRRCRQG